MSKTCMGCSRRSCPQSTTSCELELQHILEVTEEDSEHGDARLGRTKGHLELGPDAGRRRRRNVKASADGPGVVRVLDGLVARVVELHRTRRVVPEADRVRAAAVDARAVVEVGRGLVVEGVGAHVVRAAGHLDEARGALVHGGGRVVAVESGVGAPDDLARPLAVARWVGPEDAGRAKVDLLGAHAGAGEVVDGCRVVGRPGDHAARQLALVVVDVGLGQVVGRSRVGAAADDDVAAAEGARGAHRGGGVEVGRGRVQAAGELALREAGRIWALVLCVWCEVGREGVHATHDGQCADGGVLCRDALRVGGEGVVVGRVADGAAHQVAGAVVIVDERIVVGKAAVGAALDEARAAARVARVAADGRGVVIGGVRSGAAGCRRVGAVEGRALFGRRWVVISRDRVCAPKCARTARVVARAVVLDGHWVVAQRLAVHAALGRGFLGAARRVLGDAAAVDGGDGKVLYVSRVGATLAAILRAREQAHIQGVDRGQGIVVEREGGGAAFDVVEARGSRVVNVIGHVIVARNRVHAAGDGLNAAAVVGVGQAVQVERAGLSAARHQLHAHRGALVGGELVEVGGGVVHAALLGLAADAALCGDYCPRPRLPTRSYPRWSRCTPRWRRSICCRRGCWRGSRSCWQSYRGSRHGWSRRPWLTSDGPPPRRPSCASLPAATAMAAATMGTAVARVLVTTAMGAALL
eukprot:scaffold2183_cov55-Phaeocystis_antarctica.AAC.1